MLEFNILKGQYLNRLDKNVVSADTTDLKAQFELTADFTGTITVWWRRSDVDNTYTSTLAADGTCTIPAEALAATDKAVYGPYDHDVFVSISDTGRTTTNEYKLTVQRSAFSTNATPGTGGSPTAYEELVEQFDELKADNQTFKDNMTEQQKTFENTVTENVDNIRYVVETETAPPIIEEASGAEITLDDSAYRQVRGLNLYGYSKQTQTTGAQLLDSSNFPARGYGITLSIDDDGWIVLNGTSTNVVLFAAHVDTPFSGNVYYSVNNDSANNNIILRFSAEDDSTITETVLDVANKTGSYNFAQPVGAVTIRIANGTTLNNFKMRPMINSGSSALPWEPYSGGYASPSPDWAQPIHSVADEVNLLESLTMNINAPSAEFPETSDTLYVMLCPESGTSQVNIHLRYNDGSYGQDVAVVGSAGSNGIEHFIFITPSKPCTGVSIYNVTSAAARTLSYGMVAISDTALPWRPYGHNMTAESAGANIACLPDIKNAIFAGVTWQCKDGIVTVNGTAVEVCSSQAIGLYYDFTKKKGRFYISGSSGDVSVIVSVSKNGKVSYYREQSFVLDGTETRVLLYMQVFKGGTPSNKIIYPMLNRGSAALPWQPYVAPSSALIALTDSLRGIPVTSGGNYTDEDGQQWIADYIYRRQTDGKWCLWRNIKCAEYDGSTDEVWSVSVGGDNIFTTSDFSGVPLNGLCNRFRYKNNPESAGEFEFDANHSFRFYTELNGTPAWRTWLQSNPLEVVYQLATPTIEELPDDVQTELNGLYTYNLHTDMWNSDGAYMNLKYVADTKTWINNKIAGLSTAMIENL